ENGIVNYAYTERMPNGEIVNLTAEMAVWYVRCTLEEVNQALNIETKEVNRSDVGQIHDFFNEMNSEEIECFKIKQAKLSIASLPWYPPVNENADDSDKVNLLDSIADRFAKKTAKSKKEHGGSDRSNWNILKNAGYKNNIVYLDEKMDNY
ncbi:2965_t:CDS:2, partial [Entrophospora sp. SA101]